MPSKLKTIGLGLATIIVPILCALIAVFSISNSNSLIFGRFGVLAGIARFCLPAVFVIVGLIFCLAFDPSKNQWISKAIYIVLSLICLTLLVLQIIYKYASPFNEVLLIELCLLAIYGLCLYIFFKGEKM